MNKIGLIIGTLPASYRGVAAGGIATHIEGLIRSLHQKNIQTYICYHKPFGVKHPEVINSSKLGWFIAVLKGLLCLLFVREHKWRKYSLKTNVLIAYYYATLIPFLKIKNPDFVHVHSLYNPSAIALKYLKYQKPIIVTDHGFWLTDSYLHDGRLLMLLKEVFAVANKVIYISDVALIQHQIAKLGDLDKLEKISNPTSFDNYPIKYASSLDGGRYTLVFNGYKESLTTKGLRFLLATINADKYLCKNLRLRIICNDEAQIYIRKHSWNFEYEMYGRTKFEDVLEMYVQSDILVVPSKFESFGLVYTEALAVGIPVIGYYAMINEFQRTLGLYIGEAIDIENEQPADLARKIIRCLQEPFDRVKVREALIKTYDWDVLINRFLSLYYGLEITKPKRSEI